MSPLESENFIKVFYKTIKPVQNYPFPWDLMTFMDVFPESVHLYGCKIEDFADDDNPRSINSTKILSN